MKKIKRGAYAVKYWTESKIKFKHFFILKWGIFTQHKQENEKSRRKLFSPKSSSAWNRIAKKMVEDEGTDSPQIKYSNSKTKYSNYHK